MNAKTNNHRSGVNLIFMGIGIYLLVLEFTRLINFFAIELGSFTSVVYLLFCFICSALITTGMILSMRLVARSGIVAASILGIMGFPVLGIGLIYSAYLVPFTEHWRLDVNDWLLICLICLTGISLIVWSSLNLFKRK